MTSHIQSADRVSGRPPMRKYGLRILSDPAVLPPEWKGERFHLPLTSPTDCRAPRPTLLLSSGPRPTLLSSYSLGERPWKTAFGSTCCMFSRAFLAMMAGMTPLLEAARSTRMAVALVDRI